MKWDQVEFRRLPVALEKREFDLRAKPDTAKELAAWYALPPNAVNNTALWTKALNNVPDFFFQIPDLVQDIPFLDRKIENEVPDKLASGALAVKLFHLRYGRFPNDSSELIPEFLDRPPHDPWTGQNAVSRLSTNTLEIRSAGMNQIVEPDLADSDDLVIKLEF